MNRKEDLDEWGESVRLLNAHNCDHGLLDPEAMVRAQHITQGLATALAWRQGGAP